MKKILIIVVMLFSLGLQAQEESKWEVRPNNEFVMNYQMLGQSYAQGLWQGSLGYATGMWLSGGKQGWGVAGSILAVNLPILLEKDYKNPEVWVGKNLGVLTVSVTLSFTITSKRDGKMNFELHRLLRKY